jgi:hypothetical protein
MIFGIRDPRSEIRDPGWEKTRIRDPGSGINIPDPQHWSWGLSSRGIPKFAFFSWFEGNMFTM